MNEDETEKKKDDRFAWLWALGLAAFCFYAAYMVVIEGSVPTRFDNNYRTFEGIEKIVGIIPVLMGVFFIYAGIISLKDRLAVGERYRKDTNERQ